jgi:hypothetical protein
VPEVALPPRAFHLLDDALLIILVKVKLYRLGSVHSVGNCYSPSNNRPNVTGLCLPQPSGHGL